jgi:hypothetical protein
VEDAEAQEPEFQVVVPPEKEAGVYANFLGVWHSPYEFTLDFCVTQPPQPAEENAGRAVMPCLVVSRIKIPVTLIFDVVRALNENMTRYEDAFGEIKRPGDEEE